MGVVSIHCTSSLTKHMSSDDTVVYLVGVGGK